MRPLYIAPMVGKTNQDFIFFMRLMTKHTVIFTEMMHANTIINSTILNRYNFIKDKKNIVLQIAGNNPIDLAGASKIGEDLGFKEININCGCPSSRVLSGEFGISLLLKPEIVAQSIYEIKKHVTIPVSVKTRIGINNKDQDFVLDDFVSSLIEAKCNSFIIHARKAINGLSTKKNLSIPPLDYERVFRLKNKFKNIEIILNGGIKNINYKKNSNLVDGIMIGREAYNNPWIFNEADSVVFNKMTLKKNRLDIAHEYLIHISEQIRENIFMNSSLIHITGLFKGLKGSKEWKETINYSMRNKDVKPLFKFLEKSV